MATACTSSMRFHIGRSGCTGKMAVEMFEIISSSMNVALKIFQYNYDSIFWAFLVTNHLALEVFIS